LLVVVVGVAVYATVRRLARVIEGTGCRAVAGAQTFALDPEQASIAATIAGVAHKQSMPEGAVTIAYATAMQESKMHNLHYGDMDSVGVFQQRPSEGWGSTQELEDPVYATTKFFQALGTVHGYLRMPVYQAAQAVQRSADGAAYEQYAQPGAALAADFTVKPHEVTCWYTPATQAASAGVSAKLNLSAALRRLGDVFGQPGAGDAVTAVRRARSGGSAVITATRGDGWTVANWLVSNASSYGITQVSYGGYRWTAGLFETTWQPDSGPVRAGIVSS